MSLDLTPALNLTARKGAHCIYITGMSSRFECCFVLTYKSFTPVFTSVSPHHLHTLSFNITLTKTAKISYPIFISIARSLYYRLSTVDQLEITKAKLEFIYSQKIAPSRVFYSFFVQQLKGARASSWPTQHSSLTAGHH